MNLIRTREEGKEKDTFRRYAETAFKRPTNRTYETEETGKSDSPLRLQGYLLVKKTDFCRLEIKRLAPWPLPSSYDSARTVFSKAKGSSAK